jgi:hypothetical protein
MSTSIEIEVEPEEKCSHCGQDMKSEGPEMSKQAMTAELKALLNDSTPNGMSERQAKIDELMSKISEMGSED